MSQQTNPSLSIARPIIRNTRVGRGYEYAFETREEYFARVVEPFFDNLMARYTQVSGNGTTIHRDILPWNEWTTLTQNVPSQTSFTTVATLDIKSATLRDAVSVPAPTQQRFTSSFSPSPTRSSSQIFSTPDSLFVVTALASGDSAIQKFSVNEQTGDIEFVATGLVEGRLPNQFAIDESDGMLRIVTQDEHGTRVTILEQQGDGLQIVGEVVGLAPGEQLQAVRFVGERVHLVTFESTVSYLYPYYIDPLIVVDLSEPTEPTVLGELTIPGYSEYLHSIDENHLWSLGSNNGLELSIIDVTDPTAPAQKFTYRLTENAGSSSLATGAIWSDDLKHHAVAYDPGTGTLAVPVQERVMMRNVRGQSYWGQKYTLEVVHVDPETGIESLASIEHASQIYRSVIVGDRLIAISSTHVSVHDLSSPATEIARETLGSTATGFIGVDPLPLNRSGLFELARFDGNLTGLSTDFDVLASSLVATRARVVSRSSPTVVAVWEAYDNPIDDSYFDFGESLVIQPTVEELEESETDSDQADGDETSDKQVKPASDEQPVADDLSEEYETGNKGAADGDDLDAADTAIADTAIIDEQVEPASAESSESENVVVPQ